MSKKKEKLSNQSVEGDDVPSNMCIKNLHVNRAIV